MPMIAQVKHLLGGTSYHLVQHHGRPDDECGSGVTGDDLSSEIASMTRTARPDRTTSIPLVRLTTSATPNLRPVP